MSSRGRYAFVRLSRWAGSFAVTVAATVGSAQVNVVTAHNDTSRTGQNVQETVLQPSNVNTSQFGKLFSQPVNGFVAAQPLYVSQVTLPGQGVHNVAYIATTSGTLDNFNGGDTGDWVYAFDADTNGGANAAPLWAVNLRTNTTPAGVYTSDFGVLGTPVIDLSSQTMYLASSEFQGSDAIYRLHALDITTGAEKFGGPVPIEASISGTGVGSSGGVLDFDATYHAQRPALLLMNGVVYVAFASVNDQGPWHGWILSYNAKTLNQIDAFNTSPNGNGGGIWLSGAGLAGEVYDPSKPYGRLFVATGNGSYLIGSPTVSGQPYSNPNNQYGMTVMDLDLSGGVMTVEDTFTPYNESSLDASDTDLGSGGAVILPSQTLASGKTLDPLLQIGKSGMIYILDRDNNSDGSNVSGSSYSPAGLGGFNSASNASSDFVVQEVQQKTGLWGSPAYWNNRLYFGGQNASFTTYSFVNGVLSTKPTSVSAEEFYFPDPTPSISANGTNNGIAWAMMTAAATTLGNETLLAYDATNLSNTLYSTDTNVARDNPGPAVHFAVPTIANGKVYVGAYQQISIYGLFANTPAAPAPIINPSSGKFTGSQTVTISDANSGATIYYTTDGSTPTSNSAVYSNPLVVSANETITAIASATGYLQSAPASATYTSTTTPANPVLSLASGTYSGTQTLAINDSSAGSAIYYTLDGTTPTSSSTLYNGPISIPISETVQAVAVAPGLFASAVTSASYVIQPAYSINFSTGFVQAEGPMTFNGSTDLDDFRLQLTNGGKDEAGSAFFATPVNIQQFTTNFTFQLSNPAADGMTFTIQGMGPTALGSHGAGLGYGGIGKSLAIKFDLYSNAGEGSDSTGLYTGGASPTTPSIDLSSTGINLHDGDYMYATITYDGTNLALTLTDTDTVAGTQATWSHSWPINIPATVGGNTAYVGFTGGTGGLSSSQKVTFWTYLAGPPLPTFEGGFTPSSMTLNGGATSDGSSILLTTAVKKEARSAFFPRKVNVQQFVTSFDFQLTNPTGQVIDADGFTFTIQGNSPTALGGNGANLGYGGIGKSVAVKFDLYDNDGEGNDSTGLYTNGATPTLPDINLSFSPIQLHTTDIFNARLAYNGVTLTVVITDTVTGGTATQTYNVNISALVGGPTAYVGFTGGTGGVTAIQEILNWSYSPVATTGPEFTSGFTANTMTLNGGATVNGTMLQMTDGGDSESRSAFYNNKVNVQQFITGFNFQPLDAKADGFTFTIQGVGPKALGKLGMGLGYTGILDSVAVKFDLHSNAGEGSDSTGLFANGAVPTLPDVDLTSTGINLHSGDVFNAQLVYNGTTLVVLITDTVTGATATQTYTVNIPSIVGGPTAYVGFTAGTGGLGAEQDILNWTYSSEVAY